MTSRLPLYAIAIGISIVAAAPAFSEGEVTKTGELTQVAKFQHQVTGVTVSETGRIFVNFPRWTEDTPVSVAEVMKDGSLKPYPDDAWNSWRNARFSEMPVDKYFICVQSVVADGHGNLWALDPGAPANDKVLPGAAKLVKIDLSSNKVVQVIAFPPEIALQGSYLNDIRFSPDGGIGYITDSGIRGAIVVVDLKSGNAKRLLDGDPSTQLEKNVAVKADGKPLKRPDQRGPAFAADGIALSPDGSRLYWQATTGTTLYSIDTKALAPGADPAAAPAAVKKEGTTDVADGLWITPTGRLIITSPQDSSTKLGMAKSSRS